MKTIFPKWIGILTIGLLLIMCEDPEPFFNKNAVPPKVYTLNIQEIKDGTHLAGLVNLCFNPSVSNSEITMVGLFVDDIMLYSTNWVNWQTSCYYLSLDTQQFPEGPHVVTIGIFVRNPPDHGLLNLAGAPSVSYSASVVFDQTPPNAVTLESVEWDAQQQMPLLSWSVNQDLNFYGYIIYREELLGGVFVDTLYDQNTTTYLDSSNGNVIGINCEYQVIVWNRANYAISNGLEFQYPEKVPVTIDQFLGIYPPIESADGTELYVLDSDGVRAISKATNAIVRSYSMQYHFARSFALSRDGEKLYILWSYSPTISVIDSKTFELLETAEIEGLNGKNIVCGREDRIYATTSWPGEVKVINTSTMSVINTLDIAAPDGQIRISSDNNTLFVTGPRNTSYQHAVVFKIDASTDQLALLKQREASDEVRDIELSTDDATLFVIHDFDYPEPMNQFVDCWNSNTLSSYKHINVPNQAFNISVNEHTLCVSYGERYLNNWSPGGIIQYNLETESVDHDWKLKQAPYECFIDSQTQNLYAFGFYSWVIRLNNY